ncbi:MAG: hypothetical protein P8Z34_16160 [Anaerolineales bacterium]
MKTTNTLRRLCLLILTCTWLLSACGENITVPDADDTPPTISLSVLIPGEEEIVLTSESDYVERAVDRRDTITFTAIAKDEDGGVINVKIIGEVTVDCVSENYGQRKTAYLLSENPIDAGPGDTAQTVRMTSMSTSIETNINGCTGNYEFNWLEGEVYAYAENFHSGVSVSAPFHFYYPGRGEADSTKSDESDQESYEEPTITLQETDVELPDFQLAPIHINFNADDYRIAKGEAKVTIEVITPPAAPTGLHAELVCGKEDVVTLSWTDQADDETGYRVYRDGKLIAKLSANATSYQDTLTSEYYHVYSVEAYNEAGSSARISVTQEENCYR